MSQGPTSGRRQGPDRARREWKRRRAFLVLREPKSGARVGALWGKDRSSYTRLVRRRLPVSSWLAGTAWNLGWQPGEPVYALIDVTHKMRRGKRVPNRQKFWVPGPRRYLWGHALVAVILVSRGQRLPVAVEPYRTKAWCQQNGVQFRTQGEWAADWVTGVHWPVGLTPLVLLDSGLFGEPLLRVLRPRLAAGWAYPSVAQRSRQIVAGPGAGGTIQGQITGLVNTKRAFRQTTEEEGNRSGGGCAKGAGGSRRSNGPGCWPG